ncbi:hypothetical protein ACFYW8_24505 [Streptomyces sp. NPDC002742]|uniref:hypothetical protein n=1 Tax=Streptomyces sp. NPDC002742 TaxID=3364663 RepID=UPI003673FB39
MSRRIVRMRAEGRGVAALCRDLTRVLTAVPTRLLGRVAVRDRTRTRARIGSSPERSRHVR